MDAQAVDLLIIGGSGFIGARAAQIALAAGLTVACTRRTRPVPAGALALEADAADPAAPAALLARVRPRAVIYSALSWELGSEAAQMRVSRDGVTALMAALRAERVDARLVYVSTNAVFSGRRGPNREDDPPDPENRFDAYRFYGLARRAGEVAVLEGWADALVARTANVDGRDAWGEINPRLRSLIDPLRAGQPLPRYVDRWLSPTLVDAVAAGLVEVARADFALPRGRVLHLAGREPITDFAYAQRLARHLGADPALVREDHYLPEGAPGRYDISLETAFTQSCVRTPLLDVDEMLERMGIGKPSPPPES